MEEKQESDKEPLPAIKQQACLLLFGGEEGVIDSAELAEGIKEEGLPSKDVIDALLAAEMIEIRSRRHGGCCYALTLKGKVAFRRLQTKEDTEKYWGRTSPVPTFARPGTASKIVVMQARIAAGLSSCAEGDASAMTLKSNGNVVPRALRDLKRKGK